MVRNYSVRTDLALEERERFEADNVEVQGVVLEEEYDEERQIRVTRVEIRTENGAKAMGKPVGTYLTFETPDLALPDEDIHQDISKRLGGYVRELIRRNTGRSEKDLSVLVVGLGNRSVTPDALGPYVADHLNVTRHVIKEYGKYAMGRDHVNMISAVVPGVMGQTGMESTEIVRGIVSETHPDLVIAVAGGPQQPAAEPHGADRGYRDPSRLRRGQSPERAYGENTGRAGHRDRRADCGRRGDDRQ